MMIFNKGFIKSGSAFIQIFKLSYIFHTWTYSICHNSQHILVLALTSLASLQIPIILVMGQNVSSLSVSIFSVIWKFWPMFLYLFINNFFINLSLHPRNSNQIKCCYCKRISPHASFCFILTRFDIVSVPPYWLLFIPPFILEYCTRQPQACLTYWRSNIHRMQEKPRQKSSSDSARRG